MKRLALAAFAAYTLTATATAQDVDMIAGTLNGTRICGMTLDDITGMLGRPSSVEAAHPFIAHVIGPTVSYHESGLSVLFGPSANEPGDERALSASIYLARSWDSDNSEWFQVFAGNLSPAANGNWRLDRTLTELAAFDPEERTPEIQRAELEELGVLEPGEERAFNYIARVYSDGHLANFVHEPITRFLESATIACEE